MRGTGESRAPLLLDLGPLGTPAHCRLTGGGILSHGGGCWRSVSPAWITGCRGRVTGMRLPLLNRSTKPNEMKSDQTWAQAGALASAGAIPTLNFTKPHMYLQHSKAWVSAECAPAASRRGKDTAYRVRCGPCILGSMPWINTSGAGLQQQAQRASERRTLRWQDPCQMKRWGNRRGAMGTQSN